MDVDESTSPGAAATAQGKQYHRSLSMGNQTAHKLY